MNKSLSVRVLVAASLVTCGILILAGVVLLLFLKIGLSREFDRRLLNTAHNLTTTVEQVNGRITFEWEGISSGPTSIFRVYDLKGKSIAHSLGELSIDHAMIDKAVASSHEFFDANLSDGTDSRVVRLSFIPFQENDEFYNELIKQKRIEPSEDVVVLEVAFPIEDLNSIMRLASWLWIGVTIVTAVLTPLILWPMILAALSPVRNIAKQIESVDERKLSQSFDTSDCPAELLPITTRLEELMQRLNQAFEREKQITANLAHELKTPLAGLSATLELAASKPRTAEAYQQTIQKSRSIVSHLITLSERILQLARLEAGQINTSIEDIDLQHLFNEIRHDTQTLYPEKALVLETDFSQLPSIQSDRIFLKQILMNLCQNAIEHGIAGEPIAFQSSIAPHRSISISNACSGVTSESLLKLKERFFQLDSSRSTTGFHAGLGLAICDQIARTLNASLQLNLSENKRFVATIDFESAST